MFPLLKTGRIIHKKGGIVFLAKRDTGKLIKKFRYKGVLVHLYDFLPCFAMGITAPGAGVKTIQVNNDILTVLAKQSDAAKDTMLDLAVWFESALLSGKDEDACYAGLASRIAELPQSKFQACMGALKSNDIDPTQNLKDFFSASLSKDAGKLARHAALLRARLLTDIPYDRARAYEVEKRNEHDLPQLRLETLNVLASTYDAEVDQHNAQNVFRWCLANDKRLLVCRFGRAFYTDALLIANSKGIKTTSVSAAVSDLWTAFKRIRDFHEFGQLGPEVQRIINLGAKDWFPLATMTGGLDKLKASLRNLENDMVTKLDKLMDVREIQKARKVIDRFRTRLYALEKGLVKADRFEPGYVAFVSRIHELDAVNVVRVNELLDPFFGENPKMASLINETGHNSIISPTPRAWLPYASDWVEALPAYAHYTILPTSGGGYKVVALTEREVLEIIYKTCADDWARNIQDVMNRENAAVARELVAAKNNAKVSGDKGFIAFLESHEKVGEAAGVAVLVEKLADRKWKKLADLQAQGMTRYEALKNLCQSMTWRKAELKRTARSEIYTSLVVEKRRNLPNANVLTTLGPTETETNIVNWLEESMALYMIEQRKNLSADVRAKVESYRKTVGKMALKVMDEEEMEGEILRLLGEQGLRDEPANRARIALMLAPQYPEIAYKVNLQIAKKFEVTGSEANGLRDYAGPLATFTARREVVREKGLSHLLDDGRYRFASSGAFKRYHLAYTPSRVDLGPEIIESVRNVPKWVGGDGAAAAQSAKSLYALFNVAGVTAVDRPRIAEFLKVGENFFTRGGVYYLSLTAGTNINALGMGDFEFLRGEWNKRGDRTVLPTGETYGGFCVPKEFSLLFAIVTRALHPDTEKEILDAFGIPQNKSVRKKLIKDLLEVLKLRRKHPDPLVWEKKARAFLSKRIGDYLPRLPQLAVTLNKAGVLNDDPERRNDFLIADWKNKKALGMEEINRSGVFDKVRLINTLVKQAEHDHPGLSMANMTGVVSAGYKEDVTDVRFSSGARKLEVFAGLSRHLLEDIDPEGRDVYANILSDYPPPKDLRMVGLCTAKDMFGHVPMDFSVFASEAKQVLRKAGYSKKWIDTNVREYGVDLAHWKWKTGHGKSIREKIKTTVPFLVFGSNLAQIADSVNRRFLSAGLTDETIAANAAGFGADFSQWKGLPRSILKKLDRCVGAAKHVFVTEARGIYLKERYETAVTGADFLDLGIPDKELLDLIDDLPKLLYLMRNGAPSKPVILADGTAGARRFTMGFRYPTAKEKVKELFALEDKAYYGCMGIGRQDIADWKEEMQAERKDAKVLLAAILEHRLEDAKGLLKRISHKMREREVDEEYINQESAAREFKVWRPFYRTATEKISTIVNGLSLKELDFGTFLLLGGRWIFNGKVSREALDRVKEDFEVALQIRSQAEDWSVIIAHCFKPMFVPPEEDYREVETGMSGSLKAVETVALRLETREIRRRQLEQALRIHRRRSAFQKEMKTVNRGITKDHKSALSKIAADALSEEDMGAFLGLTRKVWRDLIKEIKPDEAFAAQCRQELDTVFRGGNILDSEYTALEKRGTGLFEFCGNNRIKLNQVAMALELLDIAFLIEKTLYEAPGQDTWKAVARFFDATLNNHIFDYVPYHYHSERTPAFKHWQREDLITFCTERHSFLHRKIHRMLITRTELSDKNATQRNGLVGELNASGKMVSLPVAVNVNGEGYQKWFSYARLRDLATLVFDGYPLPTIKKNVTLPKSVNLGIVYPIGNTTVSVGLEQGPKLRKNGINLFLVPFPKIQHRKGKYRALANEVFFRDGQGKWVLGNLKAPRTLHGVWFHFTHYLRPQIEKVGAPLIQPLLWEAATYLKCALPQMMKGSGYICPDQRNWYRKQSMGISAEQAKGAIEQHIKSLAARHRVVIVKAEKESGGRRSLILPVKDKNGGLLENNIRDLAELVYEISHTDNVVMQEVIPSRVRTLYSKDFLSLLQERFITELGIGIQEDTPLFSYFRMNVVKKPNGKINITHRITVVSTAGIANVGQGGRLFEYRDEKIDPRFRADLRQELEAIALVSLKSQEKYIRKNRKTILKSYLGGYKEFQFDTDVMEPGRNALGVADHEILFEMGDYMPVLLVDDRGQLTAVYSHDRESMIPLMVNGRVNPHLKIMDANGNALPFPVKLFDEKGRKRKLFWQYKKDKKKVVKSLTVVKIEPNPGAGLWRPHNDRLKLTGRDGEGVYQIFEALGEWAKQYKDKIM